MRISDLYTEVDYLYNICSIENLKSICRHGLQSKNNIRNQRFKYKDISDQEVQSGRDAVMVPQRRHNIGTAPLHSYANLYFNPRNAMMSSLLHKYNNPKESLCVLCFNKEVLNLNSVIVTNMNAACKKVNFYHPQNAIKYLVFSDIYARDWRNQNDLYQFMQAEVLVIGEISPNYISKVIVANEKGFMNVDRLNLGIQIEIDADMFSV